MKLNDKVKVVNADMEKIKKCPFCGSYAKLIERHYSYSFEVNYDVACSEETCYLCDGADYHLETKEKAIRNWNKRKVTGMEEKMFYVTNDNRNGLVVREATVFTEDKRNDEDLIIAQIGLHASTVIAANRNQLCKINDIPDKIRQLKN